jgi:hypothetical protein
MDEKLYYTTLGYGFSFLNIYALSMKVPSIICIGFGIISAIFFIRALRIKK